MISLNIVDKSLKASLSEKNVFSIIHDNKFVFDLEEKYELFKYIFDKQCFSLENVSPVLNQILKTPPKFIA